MCIAVAKQAGLAIQESILETCFQNNPDGAGYCVEVDGKLIINKGFFTFKDFYTSFAPYEYEKALIHFRIKTHGQLNEENCHPFVINDNVAMIHNGIISNVPYNKDKSDTMMFNDLYITPIVAKHGEQELTSGPTKALLEHFIGHSKLCFFIKGQEDFLIYNKQLGNESLEKIWFSNTSWQPHPTYVPTPPLKNNYTTLGLDNMPKYPINHKLPFHNTNSYWDNNKQSLPTLTKANGIFSFGCMIKTTCDINTEKGTIFKNTYGEIENCWDDGTVDIDFYAEGKIKAIYTHTLEIVTDWSSDNWGTI